MDKGSVFSFYFCLTIKKPDGSFVESYVALRELTALIASRYTCCKRNRPLPFMRTCSAKGGQGMSGGYPKPEEVSVLHLLVERTGNHLELVLA